MLTKKVEIQIVKYHALSLQVKTNVLRALCLLFGGASCLPLEGVWLNEQGNIIADDSWLVYAYCDAFDEGTLVDLARSVAIQLEQDCTMLVLDGKANFIGRD